MPAEPHPGPLDPVRILHSLPQAERDTFLAAYRQAVTEAADPDGFSGLLRLLRLWAMRTVAVASPGYAEARAAARGPVTGGMPLDSATCGG
jgi:DnaJ-domain-containing protein 1